MADQRTELAIVARVRDQASKTLEGMSRAARRVLERGFVRAFAAISGAARRARTAIASITTTVRNVGRGISRFLTPGIGKLLLLLGGFAALGNITRSAAEFERAMGEVSTIVDTTAVSMDTLSAAVTELAKAQNQNRAIVARGLYQTISSNVGDAADSLRILDQATRLARAGLADVEATTNLLTGTLNSYRQGVESAGRFSDIFFRTVEKGKTTIPELASSLSQVTPLAAQLGVPLEEIAAGLAAITASGTPTGEAVTQLAALMRALLQSSEDIDAAFKKVDERFDDNTLRTRGLAFVMDTLRRSVGGSESALVQLLGRAEATNAVLNLSGDNAERFARILRSVSDSAGATETALGKVMATAVERVATLINLLDIRIQSLGKRIILATSRAIDLAGGFQVIERQVGIVVDVFSTFAEEAITAIAEALAELERFIERLGGAERVTEVLAQGFRLAAAALKVGVAQVVEQVDRLIQVIALLPEAINEAFDRIPFLARESREAVEREIVTIEAALARARKARDDLASGSPPSLADTLTSADLEGAIFNLEGALENARARLANAATPEGPSVAEQMAALIERDSPAVTRALANLEAQIIAFKAIINREPPVVIPPVTIDERVVADSNRLLGGLAEAGSRAAVTAGRALQVALFGTVGRVGELRVAAEPAAESVDRVTRSAGGAALMMPLFSRAVGLAVDGVQGLVAVGRSVADVYDRPFARGFALGLRQITEEVRQFTGGLPGQFALARDVALLAFDSMRSGIQSLADAWISGTQSMSDAIEALGRRFLSDLVAMTAQALLFQGVLRTFPALAASLEGVRGALGGAGGAAGAGALKVAAADLATAGTGLAGAGGVLGTQAAPALSGAAGGLSTAAGALATTAAPAVSGAAGTLGSAGGALATIAAPAVAKAAGAVGGAAGGLGFAAGALTVEAAPALAGAAAGLGSVAGFFVTSVAPALAGAAGGLSGAAGALGFASGFVSGAAVALTRAAGILGGAAGTWIFASFLWQPIANQLVVAAGLMLAAAAATGIGIPIPGLAQGGVTPAVASTIPVRAFARGGIADRPTVAVFGENPRFRGEAFVPLPDGRSIPVSGALAVEMPTPRAMPPVVLDSSAFASSASILAETMGALSRRVGGLELAPLLEGVSVPVDTPPPLQAPEIRVPMLEVPALPPLEPPTIPALPPLAVEALPRIQVEPVRIPPLAVEAPPPLMVPPIPPVAFGPMPPAPILQVPPIPPLDAPPVPEIDPIAFAPLPPIPALGLPEIPRLTIDPAPLDAALRRATSDLGGAVSRARDAAIAVERERFRSFADPAVSVVAAPPPRQDDEPRGRRRDDEVREGPLEVTLNFSASFTTLDPRSAANVLRENWPAIRDQIVSDLSGGDGPFRRAMRQHIAGR